MTGNRCAMAGQTMVFGDCLPGELDQARLVRRQTDTARCARSPTPPPMTTGTNGRRALLSDVRENDTRASGEITTVAGIAGQQRSCRCQIVKLAGVAPVALASCSGAPGQNILGSYFPSWMFCALAGLGAAIVVRLGLVAVDIDKILPAPLLVYLALAVFFAFATWLAWLA